MDRHLVRHSHNQRFQSKPLWVMLAAGLILALLFPLFIPTAHAIIANSTDPDGDANDSMSSASNPDNLGADDSNQCSICTINNTHDFFGWVEFVANMSGVLTGVIGVYGLFQMKKRGLRKRIFNSIAAELGNNARDVPTNESDRLRARIFSTFAFDSAIGSGDISHFSDETQAELSRIYQEMKTYNQYLNNLNLSYELAGLLTKNPESQKFEQKFTDSFINKLRESTVKEIREVIPLVKKEIPKYFLI